MAEIVAARDLKTIDENEVFDFRMTADNRILIEAIIGIMPNP